MTAAAKRRLYTFLGLAISAVLIWLLFRGVDFVQLGEALRGANYVWLLPNIILIALSMYQRAYRWRFMLDPIAIVPFPKLLASTCIGFMANNVLPLRLGEFVRAYSLSSQDKRITKSASLATIFVERMVFDLVALLLIFSVVIAVTDVSLDDKSDMAQHLKTAAMLALSVALVGLIFMLVMARRPAQVSRLLTKYLAFLPESTRLSIEKVIDKFHRGLEFLSNPRAVVAVGIQTMLIWVMMGISNIFVFWAFDLSLPLEASFTVLVVVSVAILIPSSPGFLGIYHLAVVYSLKAYGVAQEDALSCSLVMHAAQYVTVTLMGFYYLKKEHLSLKKLEAEAGESAD